MLLLDSPTQLVSLGYEGQTDAQLLEQLLQQRVSCVVDVRLNPISRKPGLSKTRLSRALSEAGIGYLHLRALGNPKDNREGFRAGDRLALRRFEEHLQGAEAQQALAQVRGMSELETVALLCFEREHGSCHRHLVAEALMRGCPDLRLNVVQARG